MKPLRVLVTGSREWRDYLVVKNRLAKLPKGSTVIHGNARGADTLADLAARSLGFEVIGLDPEWEKYGRGAGPIRNRKMLDLKPDLVIAFHPDLLRSKGTKDCVRQARKRGIPVEEVRR